MVGPWAGPSVHLQPLVLSTGVVSHVETLIGHFMQKCGADYVSGRNNRYNSAQVS